MLIAAVVAEQVLTQVIEDGLGGHDLEKGCMWRFPLHFLMNSIYSHINVISVPFGYMYPGSFYFAPVPVILLTFMTIQMSLISHQSCSRNVRSRCAPQAPLCS